MLRSMYAGVSGLNSHQQMMDVTGNNIANVNTVGFKSSRVTFKEMLSQTIQGASAPQDNRAGTNPQQVGLGVGVGSIDSDMSSGNLQSTGKTSDVAIQGDGFFVLRDGSNKVYSRAGNLNFDENGRLYSSSTGMLVQGWMANANGDYGDFNDQTIDDIILKQEINAVETNKIRYGKNLDAEIINGFDMLNQTLSIKSGAETDSMNFNLEPLSGSDYNKWSFDFAAEGNNTNIKSDGENFGNTLSGEVELDNMGNIIGFEGISSAGSRVNLLDKEIEIDINGKGEFVNYKTIAENESINEFNLLNKVITEEINLLEYNGETDSFDFALEPQAGSDFKKWDFTLAAGDSNTAITDGTNDFGSEITGELELDENGNVSSFTGLTDAGAEVDILAKELKIDINGSGETATLETIAAGESIESENIFTEKITDLELTKSISGAVESDNIKLDLTAKNPPKYNEWDFTLNSDSLSSEFSVDGNNPTPATELSGTIERDQNGEIVSISVDIGGTPYDLTNEDLEVYINGAETKNINLADHFNLKDSFADINEVNINSQVELAEANYLQGDYELNAERNISVDAYDSQGAKHTVTLPVQKTANNTWGINGDDISIDGVSDVKLDDDYHQITFDSNGNVESGKLVNLSFIPNGTETKQTVELDFSAVTQFAGSMTANFANVNGYEDGALESFSFTETGDVVGSYSNGLTQTLAKLGLANFSNPSGLSRQEGVFQTTSNSGDPELGAAAQGGFGSLAPATLEMSNANLSQEFTNMITAQRGFQASSKLITTSDEMLQELVNLKR